MTDDASRATTVGINHVALEVGDVGDRFLALSAVDDPGDPDGHRHFGLVVDDVDAVERALDDTDAERVSSESLDFRDPWGNRVQVVDYEAIQFTKADRVLAGMGLDLEKSESAVAELAEKGMAPE